MKLKKIEITGLWHEFNVKWNLEPDVNILFGGNGAGKTTVLDLICTVIPPLSMRQYLSQKADKIKLFFEGNYVIECVNFKDSFISLKEKAASDPSYKTMFEEVSDDIGEKKKARLDFGIYASFTQFYHNGKPITPSDVEEIVNIDIVSTFDTPLPKEDEESSSFKELKESRPMSHLDKKLFDCMEAYSYYIGNLANKIEQQVLNGNDITTEFIQEVYSQKHLFGRILNELLKDSGKTVDLAKSKPRFVLSSGKHISMYDLSSGEKQILYVMLKVLLQEKKDHIMFLDEPELSLHVDWQEVLIDKILELNPNCQLIISTHSPSLLFAGWDAKVKNIDELKQK